MRSLILTCAAASRWLPALVLVATLTAGAARCGVARAQDGEALEFDLPKRVWTDSTGEYRLPAALVGYRNREVTLQREDGSEVRVSVDKLSRADREYVADRLRHGRQKQTPQVAEQRRKPGAAAAEQLPAEFAGNPDIHARQMYGIDWYNANDSLIAASADNVSDKKPIMWFRVLGDLSGFM